MGQRSCSLALAFYTKLYTKSVVSESVIALTEICNLKSGTAHNTDLRPAGGVNHSDSDLLKLASYQPKKYFAE